MPQMAPLMWSYMIICSLSSLLFISSFLYFLLTPPPHNLFPSSSLNINNNPTIFNWMW